MIYSMEIIAECLEERRLLEGEGEEELLMSLVDINRREEVLNLND